MQNAFGFLGQEIEKLRESLVERYGEVRDLPRRKPIGQLVKSLISSETRDAVSLDAYHQLGKRWGGAYNLRRAERRQVLDAIQHVTHAEKKVDYLLSTLAMIEAECPSFDLNFLESQPIPANLRWLERHPGVGRKTAAATLNFSTLSQPVFVVDRHVHRILQRTGFSRPRDNPTTTSERVTESVPHWTGADFMELFALLKQLGQTLCQFDTMQCDRCPLAPQCATAQAQS